MDEQDETVPEMPSRFMMGTQRAFERNNTFPHKQHNIGTETVYVCNMDSDWAKAGEVLVLRQEDGHWTDFDSAVNADMSTFLCHQPVFDCLGTDITRPGWHSWETNWFASTDGIDIEPSWRGRLQAETLVVSSHMRV